MGLLSRLFDPDGSSRQLRDAAAPRSPSEPDSVDALLQRTQELVLEINSSAADLPGVGVVLARTVTDAIRTVLTGRNVERLDIEVWVTINSTLTDYLPGSIRAYVGAVRTAGVDAEARATDALGEQLTTLRRRVEDLAAADRERNLNTLQGHGRFLQNKFSESELNL